MSLKGEVNLNCSRFVPLSMDAMCILDKMSKIDVEKSATQALSLALQARKCVKDIMKAREIALAEAYECIRLVDDIINPLIEHMERVEDEIEFRLESWSLLNGVESLKADEGSFKIKSEWSYQVEDMERVPASFCNLDRTAIKAAIKDGIRGIGGLKIYETKKAVMRLKNE